MATAAPTAAQLNYLMSLARDRSVPQWGPTPEARATHVQTLVTSRALDRKAASRWIDALKRQPLDTSSENTADQLTPGVYRTNGTVYVVKPNRDKTRMYAKQLVEIGGQRLTANGWVVNIDFRYAPGAIRSIRPAHRMPLREAEQLTVQYGRCIACGRALKDAQSVRQGIGPVCRKYFLDQVAHDQEAEREAARMHHNEVWAGSNGRI